MKKGRPDIKDWSLKTAEIGETKLSCTRGLSRPSGDSRSHRVNSHRPHAQGTPYCLAAGPGLFLVLWGNERTELLGLEAPLQLG